MSRVALVSGASRGIGAEIARELAAEHGFLVFAGARKQDDVERADGIEPIGLDVTHQEMIDAARVRIEADVGRLDALVNNAGVYGDPVGAAEYDLERAHEVLEVNTFGPWRMIEAFLPLLRNSSQPRIVNVSSGAGQLSDMNGGRAAYRVSKAGLNALTRTLASDERWLKVNTRGSSSTRSARAGCGPTWVARRLRSRSMRELTPPSGWRPFPTTGRPAGSSATVSQYLGDVASTQELIKTAIERFQAEVPALASLKLVFELELRGRGDVQMFRVEVPGPKITKAASTEDARVTVAIPRSDFNELATQGQVRDYIEAVENGHIRASGDTNIQKLIAQVVQRHEQRVRTKKVH